MDPTLINPPILAIDPASTSGFAYLPNDSSCLPASYDYGFFDSSCNTRHQNLGIIPFKVYQFLETYLKDKQKPSIIVIEDVEFVDNTYVAHIYGAIVSSIQHYANESAIATDSVGPGQWKKSCNLKGNCPTEKYTPLIADKFGISQGLIYEDYTHRGEKKTRIKSGMSDAMAALGILNYSHNKYWKDPFPS